MLHTLLRPTDLRGFETALLKSSLCQVGNLGGKCPEQRSEEAGTSCWARPLEIRSQLSMRRHNRPQPEGGQREARAKSWLPRPNGPRSPENFVCWTCGATAHLSQDSWYAPARQGQDARVKDKIRTRETLVRASRQKCSLTSAASTQQGLLNCNGNVIDSGAACHARPKNWMAQRLDVCSTRLCLKAANARGLKSLVVHLP